MAFSLQIDPHAVELQAIIPKVMAWLEDITRLRATVISTLTWLLTSWRTHSTVAIWIA